MYTFIKQSAIPTLLLLGLTSCTSVFSDVYSTWEYATQKRADAELSAEQIQDFPYSAMYAQRGSNPRSMIVLGFIDGEGYNAKYNWITSERETIVMKHGRLIRTNQLVPELLARTNLPEDPLLCLSELLSQQGFEGLSPTECDLSWNSVMDIQASEAKFSVATQSTFNLGQVELLNLPAGQVRALRVTEKMSFAKSRFHPGSSVTNEYWLEGDGHVVQSVQNFAPNQEALKFTQVKWVGRDYE